MVAPTVLGRCPELERLVDGLSRTMTGHGLCYGITGPSGIGKTYVLRKLERAAEGLGFVVLESCCEGGSGPERTFSPLMPSHPSPKMELPMKVLGALEERSENGPVLLAIENLHLADPDSVSILLLLSRHILARPAMIVVTYDGSLLRSSPGGISPLVEGRRLLRREGAYVEVVLQPMDRTTLLATVGEELKGSLDERAAEVVWERSEGNPMVALEASRLLIQTRKMVKEGGSWRMVEEASGLEESLYASELERIRRLPLDERQLLEVAAILGRKFDPAIIARVQKRSLLDVLEQIDDVRRRHGLIEEAGHGYWFSSPGLYSALLSDIGEAERRAIHRNVGLILEGWAVDEGYSDASEHYYRAEIKDRTVCYSILAGSKALEKCDWDDAIAHFQKVIDATEAGGFDEERKFSQECMEEARLRRLEDGPAASK